MGFSLASEGGNAVEGGRIGVNELRTIRELLWDVVSCYLKPAERDEVSLA
jgi:hypothetical protein